VRLKEKKRKRYLFNSVNDDQRTTIVKNIKRDKTTRFLGAEKLSVMIMRENFLTTRKSGL
jgi:hypothetical protein